MSNPKGLKNRGLFFQGTDDSKTSRRKTLYIADYEYTNITGFAVLDIKLYIKMEEDLDTDHP